MNRILLFIFLVSISVTTFAQQEKNKKNDSCFNSEIGFANYLADAGKINLALLALQRTNCTNNQAALDSINYLKGFLHYGIKNLDTSAFYFLRVTPASSMYNKARFFAAYNLSFGKQYDSAKYILNNSGPQFANDSLMQQLKKLELAGIALLERDTLKTRQHINGFNYNYYALADQQKQMGTSLHRYGTLPKKSAFIAGALSAVLPGAGRWYAGRKKQALGSFLQMAAMGLLTWEAYHKHGANSAPFYIFGSAFTVFYLSNIYGSAVAVKIKNNENHTILDNRILFDMHVPLRSIFN